MDARSYFFIKVQGKLFSPFVREELVTEDSETLM